MATVTWLGGHAGPNNWNNPLNWSGSLVPADGDDVVINPAVNEPDLNVTTHSLNSLTVNAGAHLAQASFAFISASIINAGTITGTSSSGDAAGVQMFSPLGTVTNSGTITGDVNGDGVSVHAGGQITNGASGMIRGGGKGVQSIGAAETLINAGVIEATGPAGIGVLFSDSRGVFDNTLTNSGTIVGTSAAVRFGAGNDLLKLLPNASFTGLVDGGGGTNTLELATGSGAGTLTGLGGSITSFGTVLIDNGAQWTLAGTGDSLSAVTVSGFTALDTIDLTNLAFASVSGSFTNGRLALANNSAQITLQIQGNFSSSDFRFSSDGSGGTDIRLAPPPAAGNPASGPASSNPATAPAANPPSAPASNNQAPAPVSEFDAAYYLTHNPDVAAAGVDPYTHYRTYGWLEGRDPNAFFNTQYYLNQNPDVAAAHMDPLLHYEQYGWREGRDPSSVFSSQAYLQANPDVAAANVDPLEHYLRYGATEGRMTFIAVPQVIGSRDPLMDDAYYLSQYADVRAAGVDPFAHYDAVGWKEGRDPGAMFDTNFYLRQNPDVAAAGIDPLLDYETNGWLQGRDPSAQFSTSKYLAANPDVKAAGVNPLLHYEMFGQHEGRAVFHD